MFRNYLLVALRSIIRNKLYSAINIGGLAIGLAAVITISLFVWDEFSYDRSFANAERIYKVEMIVAFPGRPNSKIAMLQGVAPPAMAKDFPSDIAAFTRLDRRQETVSIGDRKFRSEIAFVDSGFLQIFDFDVIAGAGEEALDDPLSVVLTTSLATILFGEEQAVGQTIALENGVEYKVSAVIADVPGNSHLAFQALVPISDGNLRPQMENWGAIGVYGYLLLQPGADPAALEQEFPAMVTRNAPENLGRRMGMTAADLFKYSLINVRDVHLKGAVQAAMQPGGDIQALVMFSAIAGLILLIACLNFMNLSTARSLSRAREVAVRKALGARRGQLITQFLGEATVLAALSLVLAIALVEMVIPGINEFLRKTLSIDIASDPFMMAALLGLTIIVGIGAGLYPAFVISAFRPATVLQANQSTGGSGSTRLRTVLVTAQFAISIGLAASTAIVYQQTEFMKNMDPGFQKENRIILRGFDDPAVGQLAAPMQRALEENPDVISTALSMTTPGGRNRQVASIEVPGLESSEMLTMDMFPIDASYFGVYGIRPVAGRLFDSDRDADFLIRTGEEQMRPTASVVINLAALDTIDVASAEEAIGRTIRFGGPGGQTEATIIGIIPDLRCYSPRDAVRAGMFVLNEQAVTTMSIHFRTADVAGLMDFVTRTWGDFVPELPADLSFLEEVLAAQYQDEDRRALLLGIFAGLAVLISALGLFALASYAVQQRTREIGIRKAMGARVADIVSLLIWQFSKPVLIANLIAWPVAGYFMRGWLASFEYRLDFYDPLFLVTFFGGAGLMALVIAWITVAGHAIRVARTNPIHALRYE